MKLSGNKILITGGASGIGLGFTQRFISEGNTVIVCSRRADVLQAAAEKFPGVVTRVGDLSSETDRVALFDWVAAEHSDLNVLVNNAGVQQWMNIDAPDFYERAKVEIVTNIEAPLHLTTLFSKLKALDTIINVTSGLAYVPFHKIPVYSATKAFFHSFSQSSNYLLKSKGIEVIEIIPPALNTDLGGKGLHDHAAPVSEFIDDVFQQLKDGKTEIATAFAAEMVKASAEDVKAAFNRLNP